MGQYVCFSVAVFVATNVLEGACMSLLSKTIPASYARGTFNSGFLATESGTAGRAVGDVIISYIGAGEIGNILNGTFVNLFAVTVVALRAAYPRLLAPKEKDDEDSGSKSGAEGSLRDKHMTQRANFVRNKVSSIDCATSMIV